MSIEINLSQEQMDLISAGSEPAIETLLQSGEFHPTLYVQNGEEIVFFTLAGQSMEDLRDLAKLTLKQRTPNAPAYVMFYGISMQTTAGPKDALAMETGDVEYDGAYIFVRGYSRSEGKAEPQMRYQGDAPHLLK